MRVQYAATAYIYRTAASGRSVHHYGRCRGCLAKWRVLTIDADHQRRGVDLSDYVDYADAIRRVGRFLDEVWTAPPLPVHAQRSSIGTVPAGQKGMVTFALCSYVHREARCQFPSESLSSIRSGRLLNDPQL
jgi:hypothetical protein